MVNETIFQHWIVTQFILPFTLMTAIVYGVLEKLKLLGEDKHQLNAIVAFVIGLIFVGAVFPKLIVGNLILFLTVALIVLFVILLLWGFVSTKADKGKGFELESWMKYILLGTISVAAIFAVLWAAGVDSTVIDLLFNQGWSNTFWTNFFFVIVIAGVLALFLKMKDNE